MNELRSPMSAAVEMQRSAFEQTMSAVEQSFESQREIGEAVVDTYVDLFTAVAPEEAVPMLEGLSPNAWYHGEAGVDTETLAAFETYSEELAEAVETRFAEFETQAEELEHQLAELTAAATEPGETTEAAEDVDASDATADLESINGIGPTYAGRLADDGIESVAELAAADVEAVAAAAEVAETRADEWIAAAQTQA